MATFASNIVTGCMQGCNLADVQNDIGFLVIGCRLHSADVLISRYQLRT